MTAWCEMFGAQYNCSYSPSLNSKGKSSQVSQAKHNTHCRTWRGQGRRWAGGLPAKSTRFTLAESMVVKPASSVVLLSTTQVKTEWDLLDSLFMLVAAVCLFCWPRRSRRAVSSTAGTSVLLSLMLAAVAGARQWRWWEGAGGGGGGGIKRN